MRSRYKIFNQEGLFFVSSTIVEWIPVFTNEKYFQIISESISYCQNNKGMEIIAYVIMDNHFHLVCKDLKLTDTMRSIKGFTASRIIEEIQKDNKSWLLNQFSGVAGKFPSPGNSDRGNVTAKNRIHPL